MANARIGSGGSAAGYMPTSRIPVLPAGTLADGSISPGCRVKSWSGIGKSKLYIKKPSDIVPGDLFYI